MWSLCREKTDYAGGRGLRAVVCPHPEEAMGQARAQRMGVLGEVDHAGTCLVSGGNDSACQHQMRSGAYLAGSPIPWFSGLGMSPTARGFPGVGGQRC